MEKTRLLLLGLYILIFSSCSTILKFPVSEVIPGADIKLKQNQDQYGNYEISIKAKYLADPARLTPPKEIYVVWANTAQGYKNLGQLTPKNTKTAELKTLTPFKATEILITAESQGNISFPAGIEITRVLIND